MCLLKRVCCAVIIIPHETEMNPTGYYTDLNPMILDVGEKVDTCGVLSIAVLRCDDEVELRDKNRHMFDCRRLLVVLEVWSRF